MCGFAGIFSSTRKNLRPNVKAMTESMIHRGPDSISYHTMSDFCLGHVRLSIIDLNERSNQPFYNNDKRFIIVFNGEIYNYKQIKKEIGTRYNFITESDTEVLLASYIIFGKSFLNKLNGCFAFAIFDNKKQTVFFARDRLGIKPLYYFKDDNYLIFSSELRAILKSGLVKKI